jgi:hypothetical protein
MMKVNCGPVQQKIETVTIFLIDAEASVIEKSILNLRDTSSLTCKRTQLNV